MRFIPTPRSLAAHVLGVTLLRPDQDQPVPLPAHALAIFTLVYRGALVGRQGRVEAGALLGQGAAGEAQIVTATAGTVCASLLCRASILPLLCGEPASLFADRSVPPALAGLDAAALQDRLGPDPSDGVLAQALFAQIGHALRQARPARSSAVRFALAMQGWGAAARPADVPPGWTERQWQRACQAELGVTPKFLQRLNRLHASVRSRLSDPALPLSTLALDAGFFDQAHMAREYRLLAGAPPRLSLDGSAPGREGMALGAGLLAPRFFGH